MSEPVHQTQWLAFYDLGPCSTSGKTRVFGVLPMAGSRTGNWLGHVKWYAPWRRYNFFPTAGASFDAQCLQDLSDFCRSLMEQRKARRRAA